LDIRAGHLIDSRYRILNRLGEGGMGVVYLATDEQLRRTIALKVLSPQSGHDADRLRRFRNEARVLSTLNHPHIVTIYEVGEEGGAPFFVMEFVDGETLRSRLREGPLPVGEVLDLASQVARGLAAAHEQGLIHRDIKPENVMIRRDGYVKILDFGIARLRDADPDAATVTGNSVQTVTGSVVGTPAYMAPEQIDGGLVDARTDLFALGVLMCEALLARNPFARVGVLETAVAIRETPKAADALLAQVPADVRAIAIKALQRDPDRRYTSATEIAADLRKVAVSYQRSDRWPFGRRRARQSIAAAVVIAAGLVGGAALWYRRSERRAWVHEQAVPQIAKLADDNRTAEALRIIQEAERYSPADPALLAVTPKATRTATIRSAPEGATVDVQDYSMPDSGWLRLGVTPLDRARVPSGYLRWRVSKAGIGESVTAPPPIDTMTFDLDAVAHAPDGMIPVKAGEWQDYLAFFGWLGPFALPAYDIDRFEVTNRQFQVFLDSGGYANHAYWTQPFVDGARTLSWAEAMERFRDSTGRPGPATWSGSHFPEDKAEWPVTGVSWYEAAAYAEFAHNSLPVMAQVYEAEPTWADQFVLPFSNLTGALAPTGQFRGLGISGTYDLIGNAREWSWNGDGTGLKYTLGRLPGSYGPEALPPFDRSTLNGFRCVRNLDPVPDAAAAPRPLLHRDFSTARAADDEAFRIYRNMYAYDRMPLDAVVDPARSSTADWTQEKITFRTAYGQERMAAYLFLPKHARAPFQTVMFFPSARSNFLSSSADLGDLSFVDYVVQSGRAVMYPIYKNLYERRTGAPTILGPTLERELIVDWSKDLGRSLDYLETRQDIDRDRIAYLGVSQGAAYGVILAALEDRLKAVVFLDGGFFQFERPIAGLDQVDFAPRLRKPVLMVNGRFDATFPYNTAQRPMFEMLGTPAADKRHVVFDTPHDVRFKRADLVREVLTWLDKYLGRVI
jgi:hypothetical protein